MAQMEGSFIDARDGQQYQTISYEIKRESETREGITWMAQNLNYEMDGSYCRNDSLENCEQYGRFYDWPAALKACPSGWHLPNDEDWMMLVNLYGGIEKAGKHLRSKSYLWSDGGKGTNKSKFNAMPYGTGTSHTGYPQFTRNAVFWSADEASDSHARDWILVSGWDKIMHSDGHKLRTGNAVRCIRD